MEYFAGLDVAMKETAICVVDAEGKTIEQFEPGLIAYARGGKDIKFNQPASTAGVSEWLRAQLHIIAAGYRVPYELLTGDLSQVNYSSLRGGLVEFRRMVDADGGLEITFEPSERKTCAPGETFLQFVPFVGLGKKLNDIAGDSSAASVIE